MSSDRLPSGALIVEQDKSGTPSWNAKWRHLGTQKKRRIGRAWVVYDEASQSWVKRAGRPPSEALDRHSAIAAMHALIASHHEQYLAEQERSLHASTIATPTFAEASLKWLERAIRRQRKPATIRNYRQILRCYILPTTMLDGDAASIVFNGQNGSTGNGAGKGRGKHTRTHEFERCPFATMPVDEIDAQAVRKWFETVPRSRTRSQLLMVVRSILHHAVSEHWVETNVATIVERDPVAYDGSYDYFTTAEVERLIEAAADEHDAALYACAALGGLRKGELIALQWRDVDLTGHRIIVRRNLSAGEITTPKSGRVRVVPMVPRLGAMLRTLSYVNSPEEEPEEEPAEASDSRGRSPFVNDDDYVFAKTRLEAGDGRSSAKQWADPSGIDRRYRAALERANLRKLPLHGLRHYFGSQAVCVASLVQVRDWLGHSDIKTTARYLHAKPLATDAALLASAF